MSSSPVMLILGAGPGVGQSVAQAFAAKGYRIALASRKAKGESTKDQVHFRSDLSDPKSLAELFSNVKKQLGPPSVVVYNAAGATFNEAKDPLSIPLDNFTQNLAINTTSAFAAGQQAVLAFKDLPDSASKTFVYTGNALNTTTMGPLLDLGVGKSATAHIIESAAVAYAEKGFKFYYADERKEDGSPAGQNIDGKAHADLYVHLSEGKEQGPWQQTFVKGLGYKKFPAA
ncbi:MAG: hypothetical protein Q9169_008062 [Polycauliona sp. 2 TL-2023]